MKEIRFRVSPRVSEYLITQAYKFDTNPSGFVHNLVKQKMVRDEAKEEAIQNVKPALQFEK